MRYRIINHKNGTYISTYDSIEKQNKYISSFTNSFERFEGLIISHGYQGNEILECTMDSTKVRYRINIDNKIPPAGFWAQDGKDYVQIVMEEAEKDTSVISQITWNQRKQYYSPSREKGMILKGLP